MFCFEIQLDWFPGCGWLRSPFPRDTWEQAFEEGKTYVEFAWKYRGQVASFRVVEISGDVAKWNKRLLSTRAERETE